MKKEIYNQENWTITEYTDNTYNNEYLIEIYCPECNMQELFNILHLETGYKKEYLYLWINAHSQTVEQLKKTATNKLMENAHYFLVDEIKDIPELLQANQVWHESYFDLTVDIAKRFVEQNKEMRVEDIYQLKKEDELLRSFVLKYIQEKAKQ